jgi:hypothetical protein
LCHLLQQHDKALSVFRQPLTGEMRPTGVVKEILDRFVRNFFGQEEYFEKHFQN